ncbi:hypothetical protein [Hymenobacter rigui]|uniref:hypothetical protein n=1 Tax=Hymenobacter rigui TaxID=334424 RepID=UPI0014777767|nr:hypothetical protein [Hymenobacter rigui]
MAISTPASSSSHRRRRRRHKPDTDSDTRNRKLTVGFLGLLMIALLASLGVIAASMAQ